MGDKIDQNDLDPMAVAGQYQPEGEVQGLEPYVEPVVEVEQVAPPATPAPAPPVSRPRGGYRKPQMPKAKAPQAPRTQAAALQQTLPSPERVKVSRRRPDGRVALINYYGYKDLERYRSIEAFLHRYIVPQYGPGEYIVHYVTADGLERAAGEVIIEEPPTKETGPGQPGGLDDVARIYRELQAQADAKAVDPMEQFQKFLHMQKQLGAGESNAMMMMLMMQQQQQRQPDQMELVTKLAAALRPPPPPPVMAGPDPTATMLAEVMRQNNELTRTLIESLKGPKDSIGARDLVTMLPTFKDLVKQPEKNHLREALESVELMKRAMSDMEPSKSGFRDFAEGLLPKGIDSVTELIQTIRQKDAAMTGVQNLPAGQAPQQQQVASQFPETFRPYAAAIGRAADGPAAIEAVLHGFFHLGNMPEYRPALENLIRLARGGEKDQALEFIQGFLEALVESNLVPLDKANLALETFEKHWDDVVKKVLGGDQPQNNSGQRPTHLQPVPNPTAS